MPLFPFFRWPRKRMLPSSLPTPIASAPTIPRAAIDPICDVRRHFYNERGFQCYASFFAAWDGWITAGHVLTDAAHKWPDFTPENASETIWPAGLDAAFKGCTLPSAPPPRPVRGKSVTAFGFPAGAQSMEARTGTVYLERGQGSGIWIMHIQTPDEPVVTGMSGGPVIDTKTGLPLGILITRNSPADLNADRDPDESCDFVSLRAVWEAVQAASNTA